MAEVVGPTGFMRNFAWLRYLGVALLVPVGAIVGFLGAPLLFLSILMLLGIDIRAFDITLFWLGLVGLVAGSMLLPWWAWRSIRPRQEMQTDSPFIPTFDFINVIFAMFLVGLFFAIAIPNVVKARMCSSRNSCIANLKQIEGAKATWALEYQQPPTAVPTETDLFGPNRYISTTNVCPQGGIYRLGAVGEKPTCSLGASDSSHDLGALYQRPGISN
jgi:hypothetical protein